MDRRDFLKTLAAAGTLAALPRTAASEKAGTEAASASGQALAELLATISEAEERYLGPEWNVTRPGDVADGRRFLMHVLLTSLDQWLEADPERPRFHRYVSPSQKLLGDNPDAVYFTAPIRPDRRYRVRGNLAGATYTSFTVEGGNRDGHYPKRVAATMNDAEFEAGPDGSYEIAVGGPKQSGNWLALADDAGTVTTRHYFERERSVAADPTVVVPISIEPVDDPGPAPTPDDASIAASIRRVRNFVRAVTLDQPPPDSVEQPPFVSKVPNSFPRPIKWESAFGGLGAVDNAYSMAPYVLMPDQALVVRGRFPRCRFANVVLWNRFLQTYDYAHRRVSLNRKQTALEPDGSFRMVIAHRDPGVPNWLDTEGRPSGMVFWRFQLPDEEVAPLSAEVVPLADVAKG